MCGRVESSLAGNRARSGMMEPGAFWMSIFICGCGSWFLMHDTESDTFVYQTWPEKFSVMLKEIGVESESLDVGSCEIESGDYYSRYFAQTPRMVTNRGCLDVKGSNIDMVQIIQKG